MQTDHASLSGATFCITVDEHVANSVRSSEHGAWTVASVINIARPSMSVVSSICGDRRAVAKFSKFIVWDKVSQRSTVIFKDTRISYQHSAGQVEGSPDAKISSMR